MIAHETDLIATITIALALAFVLGFIASRLRIPVIVGYLVAGVLVGPFTPGFEASTEIAPQLAEIGVILLLFGVGIHFSLGQLLEVRRVVIVGAVLQSTVATLLVLAVARWWGWDVPSGLVLGLCLSVASTVVLLRALLDEDMLGTTQGRIAVGWLIVQDLLMVVVLVVLPLLAEAGDEGATTGDFARTIAFALGKVVVVVGGVLLIGTRAVPWLLVQVSRTRSRELFTLSVLGLAFGVAFGSAALFGVSMALGAFLAGLVMGESDLAHRAAEEALPMRDAFAVLFFVSVGMVFDPALLLDYPLELIALLLIVVVATPLVAFTLVTMLGHPARTALVVAAGLAQIGEFSFILAELGDTLDVLPPEGHGLVIAVAIVSISINPFFFRLLDPLERFLRARGLARDARVVEERRPLADHVVLCGYGRVGRFVAGALEAGGVPFVVVERDRTLVEELRERGVLAVQGDAADRSLQEHIGLAKARQLVLAIPDPVAERRIAAVARAENPAIVVIARTHSEEERAYLRDGRVDEAVLGEHELARTMARLSLDYLGVDWDEPPRGDRILADRLDSPFDAVS